MSTNAYGKSDCVHAPNRAAVRSPMEPAVESEPLQPVAPGVRAKAVWGRRSEQPHGGLVASPRRPVDRWFETELDG